jgi:Fur family transcriptional regulator, ferric uptake regulator
VETITVLVIVVENRYHRRMSVWASEVQHRLRRAGYRNGTARTALVELLDTQACCASAADLHETLRQRGRNVGLASVYRVLESLLQSGLIQRVDVGDGVARYEPVRTSEEHHHHLVCTGCGKVEAFTDPSLERAIHHVEKTSGYAVDTHDVVLHGACADCRRAA